MKRKTKAKVVETPVAMTEHDFTVWLQGYLAAAPKGLTAAQVEFVKAQLGMVTTPVTISGPIKWIPNLPISPGTADPYPWGGEPYTPYPHIIWTSPNTTVVEPSWKLRPTTDN